jgi:hypothetical protein
MQYFNNEPLVDELLNPASLNRRVFGPTLHNLFGGGVGKWGWIQHMVRFWVRGFQLALPMYSTVSTRR